MAERHLIVRVVNRQLERRLRIRLVRVESRRDTVRRPHADYDRLLPSPVFLLSSVRSGSTLLRLILNSHSQIHAPHETHFRRLSVTATKDPARQAMQQLDLNERDLEHLLWDRLLHRELTRSGKSALVEKTPSNVFVVERLHTAWPASRFIFLLRHPLSIAQSWRDADPERRPMPQAIRHTLNYMEHLERARTRYRGLTIRYEDLVADPAAVAQAACQFVGVPFESGMLQYGRTDHGDLTKGIGDWRTKIRTGVVQPGRPLPDPAAIPDVLRPICRQWGYQHQL